MRYRIDAPRLNADARAQLEPLQYNGAAPLLWPADFLFTLDQRLHDKRPALEQVQRDASPEAKS
jgi:hypothetical protein